MKKINLNILTAMFLGLVMAMFSLVISVPIIRPSSIWGYVEEPAKFGISKININKSKTKDVQVLTRALMILKPI
jgi:hypothetical protein